jgi:hypothetical protein
MAHDMSRGGMNAVWRDVIAFPKWHITEKAPLLLLFHVLCLRREKEKSEIREGVFSMSSTSNQPNNPSQHQIKVVSVR